MNFRDLHRAGDPLLLPNAWDYGSAACLAAHGSPRSARPASAWQPCTADLTRPAPPGPRRSSWRRRSAAWASW
ncbi:hypothetical protein ACFQQB_36410 [Nonomuraea rubra]|uniref:hypothetical protein n=1 Tax=Nonomuraea rubra TaxID=46180 RepID=UPI0036222F67